MKIFKGNEEITLDLSPAEYRTFCVAISQLSEQSPFGKGDAFGEAVDVAKQMTSEVKDVVAGSTKYSDCC